MEANFGEYPTSKVGGEDSGFEATQFGGEFQATGENVDTGALEGAEAVEGGFDATQFLVKVLILDHLKELEPLKEDLLPLNLLENSKQLVKVLILVQLSNNTMQLQLHLKQDLMLKLIFIFK